MAKRGDAGSAPAPEAGVVHQDDVAASGTALHVEGIGAAAVALGEAVASKGAPAVGEGQVAEVVPGPAVETTRLADAADRPRIDDPATRGPTDRLIAQDRVLAGHTVAVAHGRGRHKILPLGGPAIDPDSVPGRKVATAAAQVRHSGRSYVPGETFAVDFRAHSELVPIGAIVATPWHELPDADED